MARYNVDFQLSIEDMELIEDALRQSKTKMASNLTDKGLPNPSECEEASKMDASVRKIHDLLGRLHNQKVFFRPRQTPYVSG